MLEPFSKYQEKQADAAYHHDRCADDLPQKGACCRQNHDVQAAFGIGLCRTGLLPAAAGELVRLNCGRGLQAGCTGNGIGKSDQCEKQFDEDQKTSEQRQPDRRPRRSFDQNTAGSVH